MYIALMTQKIPNYFGEDKEANTIIDEFMKEVKAGTVRLTKIDFIMQNKDTVKMVHSRWRTEYKNWFKKQDTHVDDECQ